MTLDAMAIIGISIMCMIVLFSFCIGFGYMLKHICCGNEECKRNEFSQPKMKGLTVQN
jgi:hypothetical protein